MDRIIDVHVHFRPSEGGDEYLLDAMDRAGVEKAVVLAVPDHERYRAKTLDGTNDVVEALVRRHPERLMAGIYIDPRTIMDAQTAVRRARDKGFSIVKAWPAHGFAPDDQKIYPVWEVMNELKMAILFHSGILGTAKDPRGDVPIRAVRAASFNSKYGQPILLDQPARLFPDLQFIIAHAAYPWTLEALEVSFAHPNVWIDLSCPLGFEGINLIEKIQMTRIPWNKMLWASDTCGGDGMCRYVSKWQEILNRPFFSAHRSAIFFDNAATLMRKICA